MLFPPVRRAISSERRVGLAFAAGAVAGALVSALLVLLLRGLLSPVRGPALTAAFLGIAAVTVVLQAATGRCRLPQRHWQIPADWVSGRHASGARDFGFVLGMGVFTYVPSCSAHVLLLAVLVAPVSVVELAAIAVGFGLGRSAEVLAWSLLPRPADGARELGRRLVAVAARWLAPATMAAIAAVALVA